MPPWALKLPWDIIEHTAANMDVSPRLVAALIQSESANLPKTARLEAGWPFYYKPRELALAQGISEETEKSFQRHSWGLMQVMGGVARELGFKGFLPDLCDPETGILYGCMKIREIAKRYQQEDDIISAYNMGTPRKNPEGSYWNQAYVDRVHRSLDVLKGFKLIE